MNTCQGSEAKPRQPITTRTGAASFRLAETDCVILALANLLPTKPTSSCRASAEAPTSGTMSIIQESWGSARLHHTAR
ncbi:MAG: hypothetical protein JJE39_02415 [Vicinamibacteria bacterium]|nr:hypothetical protein [Vicinamibacteria bacterium]